MMGNMGVGMGSIPQQLGQLQASIQHLSDLLQGHRIFTFGREEDFYYIFFLDLFFYQLLMLCRLCL